MRGGYFLAEESPQNLMQQMSTDSLEEVYLKLSVRQNSGRIRRSSISEKVVQANMPTGVVNVRTLFSVYSIFFSKISKYLLFL